MIDPKLIDPILLNPAQFARNVEWLKRTIAKLPDGDDLILEDESAIISINKEKKVATLVYRGCASTWPYEVKCLFLGLGWAFAEWFGLTVEGS